MNNNDDLYCVRFTNPHGEIVWAHQCDINQRAAIIFYAEGTVKYIEDKECKHCNSMIIITEEKEN